VLIFGVFVLSVSSSFAASSTHVINVGDNNTKIQSVIDNAASGDIIEFSKGTYNDISLKINKSITLKGNNSTLNGVSGDPTKMIMDISNSDVPFETQKINISSFIINCKGPYNALVAESGSKIYNLNFEYLKINVNSVDMDGIRTKFVDGFNVKFCEIYNARRAINVLGGSNMLIAGNNFHDIYEDVLSISGSANDILIQGNTFNRSLIGVYFGGGVSHINIIGNNFINNSAQAVSLIKAADNVNISNNNFLSNSIAIEVKANDTSHNPSNPTVVSNVTIVNNVISNSSFYGVFLYNIVENQSYAEGRSIVVENNSFSGNGWKFKEAYTNGISLSDSDYTNFFGSNNIVDAFDLVNYLSPYDNSNSNGSVGAYNFSIKTSLDKNSVVKGNKVIYTITIKNTGGLKASNLSVDVGIAKLISKGFFSAVVDYKSASSSYSNGKWVINSLDHGDTAVLVLELITKSNTNKVGSISFVSSLNSGVNGNINLKGSSYSLKITDPDKKDPTVKETNTKKYKSVTANKHTLKIKFSEKIKVSSAMLKKIVVKNSKGKIIKVSLSVVGNYLYVNMPKLAKKTKYTVNIPKNVVSDIAGNFLKNSITLKYLTK